MSGWPLLVGQAFWLSASVIVAGILHMIAVKRDWWPSLKRPIDGGRTFRGVPVFGPNKTWRGVVVMVVGAALLAALQGLFLGRWAERSGAACLDFRAIVSSSVVLGYAAVGAVLGFGYAAGELPNSFAKRRLGVVAGKRATGTKGALLLVVDQADSVVAPLVLGQLIFGYGWAIVLAGSLFLTALHLLLNGLLYATGVRREL